MRSATKPLLILAVFYLIALLFAAALALFRFPGDLVHPSFTGAYILADTVHTFFVHLFAFHGAGLLVAFSLFVSVNDLRSAGANLFVAARTTVIGILVVGLLYTVGTAWLLPATLEATSDLEYRSSLAEDLRADAEIYEESRQFSRAVAALESYRRLVDEPDEGLEERIATLRSRAEELRLEQEPRPTEGERRILRSDEQELGPAELVGMARDFFEEGDYYSAHYYAELALRLSESSRQDARRLSSQAWERITSYALSTVEESRSDYFRRKRAAYQTFLAGSESNESLIEAYYMLTSLQEERPGDEDVRRYLSQARRMLREVSFFVEDAEIARSNPGPRDILALNDRSATEWEVLRLGKMVRYGGEEYLYDIEVVRFDTLGDVRSHFVAPYGKIIGGRINMQAISRDSAQVRAVPEYIHGNPREDLRYIHELRYEPEELATAAAQSREEANLSELVTLRNLAVEVGIPKGPVELELFQRLGAPFLFLALSYVFLGFGWGLRSQYVMRPPAVAMLFIPTFPLVAELVYSMVRYVFRVFSASMLLSFSMSVAAIISGLVLLLFLIFGLYSVARRSIS